MTSVGKLGPPQQPDAQRPDSQQGGPPPLTTTQPPAGPPRPLGQPQPLNPKQPPPPATTTRPPTGPPDGKAPLQKQMGRVEQLKVQRPNAQQGGPPALTTTQPPTGPPRPLGQPQRVNPPQPGQIAVTATQSPTAPPGVKGTAKTPPANTVGQPSAGVSKNKALNLSPPSPPMPNPLISPPPTKPKGGTAPNWLSPHPSPDNRITRFEDNLKAIDEPTKRSQPGKQNPPKTVVIPAIIPIVKW
jgi:hypothetical protein